MPAPSVTSHRVGKNAVITVNGTAARHEGGTVNSGGGTDTRTLPSGFPIRAATNLEKTGDFRLIVLYGEANPIPAAKAFINLNITDGTNVLMNGVAFVDSITDSFQNDQGWEHTINWLSHDDYAAGTS